MCKFFSITSDGQGNIKYFDWAIRKKILSGELKMEHDSHTSINHYFGFKGALEDSRNKYEYNPLTQKITTDMINGFNDSEKVEEIVRNLDFKTICEPLIIKSIINPFKIQKQEIKDNHKQLLKVWASVWDSVGASVGASVWDSVRASVGASVWASVWAYISSFFNIKEWKYTNNEPFKNPYQTLIDLWEIGIIPSFDGNIWRLHSGNKADIVFEISAEELKNYSENKQPEPLYTIIDCARLGQFSDRKIYNHIKSGDLKAAKIGRQWRVNREDFESWLRGR